METVIDAQDITKVYNEKSIPVHAVNGVHLHIEKGEFTALVGPSGSGKTTVLNIIGGLDHPTSGQVVVNGTDITKMGDNKLISFRLKNIGFVFQSYDLIPVLTAKE
ncbi:MAG: ATP-binding cassette domain-containing protein, partial [Bacteroidetes bacterium]